MDFNLGFESLQSITKESTVRTLTADELYQSLIIGGGPAALTAAVYLMRKGVSAGLVTESYGGQVVETAGIENYMGYHYIDGSDLADKFKEQVRQFPIAIADGVRVVLMKAGDPHQVTLSDGRIISSKTVIIATGKSWRKLGVPGEKELTGHGVAYCTICDAPLFKDKDVIVVGGGNSGVESALDLLRVASHVTIVQNLDKLTADQILIDKILPFKNLSIIYKHSVEKIIGDKNVKSVMLKSLETEQKIELAVSGIFIEIGLVPNSSFVEGVVSLNKFREILIDARCSTSVPGIFAAGDVTDVPYKQIIIAAGEGAKAALSAYDFLMK
jgi:NADH-dependent peroxiredoxin subunit F